MAEDHFSDLNIESLGLGALEGQGGKDHYGSSSGQSPDGTGVQFAIHCDVCGQPQHVKVSWDELIFVSEEVPPPGNAQSQPWAYSARHGALHPTEGCCGCGRRDTLVMLTPDEARRHLNAGIAARRVSGQYVQNGAQQVRTNYRRS